MPGVGSSSSSIRGRTTTQYKSENGVSIVRLDRTLKKEKKEEDEDIDKKRDKDSSEAPSLSPIDSPSDKPTESPTDDPSDLPSFSPSEAADLLLIELDENSTALDDDSIDIYSGNLTESNASWWNETDDFPMEEESSSTDAPTKSPTESSTDIVTQTQVVMEVENENVDEDLMPCYWRFLTGSYCTNYFNGDVINAHHHQYVVSDGQCHYNDFLGYYRARCAASQPEVGENAQIFLQDVFCSDPDCSSCLQHGIVRPEFYSSHMCNHMHFPATSRNSMEYDFAFEFVGGCFENESCSRIAISGDGSWH